MTSPPRACPGEGSLGTRWSGPDGCAERNDSVPCGTVKIQNNVPAPGLLDEILGRTPHVRVLRFLCRVPGAHSGRAIARATGVSHPAVHRVLRTLAGRGMAAARRHGRALAYALNTDHWLVRDGLAPLFATEEAWLREVGAEVRKAVALPVRSILLFGSAARGDASAESDLDVLCLLKHVRQVPAAERALAPHGDRFRRRFGRDLSVMVMGAGAFRRRFRRRERLVREIVETGWVIDGAPVAEVLA